MRSVIKVSKTIDEAIKEALIELNANKDDVEIEIIDEPSKGLFGLIGGKDAKVRVSVIYDPIEMADNFLCKVLSSMNIDAVNVVKKEGDNLTIDIKDISSTDMGILIGKRGNTLDAIQYLLSLVINKNKDNYIKVIVDIEGYRAKREETLIRLANKMAEKAKYVKRPIKLEPMNPYERRIIHSALQNIQGITTYSEGDEPYRRVVIQSK
ncbi:RNA-binding cell elongation regulator Jag/EloR [Tissierella praeacuta]|uniref:RNA-binding protein KhpB n=1 Tax=Tissierella praeacuta DSM 18095 TaxID=1123404 RepID=A0A1M4YZS3_9FIRM|nr:RNA-binding cell elongation regulator Jag/EloR [Tissierella praeacuta]MBU5257156.1 protein jag [Tissierella praeacuta]TCU66249.1 spoIIIJ-associated protein [Tissierella praeacuta]SHF11309.1 spoIIIJ-associated protein [Tissierella praeacuta DSM 18095]SUP04946.1 Predicted RNA-binding protein (contains KH domain) [Tissierella praeacuta]